MISELRWIVLRPSAWLLLVFAGALSGITSLVMTAAGRPRPAPSPSAAAPAAEVIHLELLFGGVLVAVGFGLLGARPPRIGYPRSVPSVGFALARLILLLLLLAPALVIVHVEATIIASLAPAAPVTPANDAVDPGTLLLRGWLALLPFAAAGYAAGTVLRKPLSGLLVALALLALDGLVGAILSSRPDIWWLPVGNAVTLISDGSGAWLRAAAMAIAYLGMALVVVAVVTSARRPAQR